jgi:hypothetical protein
LALQGLARNQGAGRNGGAQLRTHPRPRGPAPDPSARGWENVQKRYLVQVAGDNLGVVMRQLLGAGTPKELAARGAKPLWLLDPALGLLVPAPSPARGVPRAHISSTGC